jgi:hypothetical protein
MKLTLVTLIFFPIAALALCEKGQLCQLDIPGAKCADGSQSYINYIDRGSENLFIYAQGGGACFDAVTCGCRVADKKCKGSNEGGDGALAGYLSRPPEDSQIHPWSQGEDSPIGQGNYVEIVYCTGDVYTGAGQANYGTKLLPLLVGHYGAKNFELSIDQAKTLFPAMKKVTVVGSSAGGLGVTYNLHHIVRNFGDTELSVINDSGIPIFAKYLNGDKIQQVLKSWNVSASLPSNIQIDGAFDFEDIYKFNAEKFGNIRWGLVGATEDAVFTSYFRLLGGNTESVSKALDEAAELMKPASNHHYFFDRGKWHTATFMTSFGVPKKLLPTSHGVNVEEWIASMVSGSKDWDDIAAD